MAEPEPRLVATLTPESELADALGRGLPSIPWAYLSEVEPARRGSVEAMLVGSFSRDAPLPDFSTFPRLAFIQRAFTGLDGFPFDRVPPGVRIAGNVGAFAPFVAEHAVTLALAAARLIPLSQEMVRAGRLRPAPEQRLLYGSTAVVLGFGEIGHAIAAMLGGFGVRVIAVRRTATPDPAAAEVVGAESFRDVLGQASFVFECRPLTARTRGSIGRAELERMRGDAVFVNVGRAATVDEAALYEHLRTHPEFRAGLDVWWSESYREGLLGQRFPFATLPNVVGTPHCAGYAPGAEERGLRMAIENLARFFRDGRPLHVVDRAEYP